MREFLAKELKKYISEKGVLCVHDGKYYNLPSKSARAAGVKRNSMNE